MGMQKVAQTIGLYLSVPFCRAKCSFCNFASGVGTAQAVERYVGLLCAEIASARKSAANGGVELPERVETVYFGGGTPSLLEPGQLRRLFPIDNNAEITLEAAPGQIGDDLLDEAQRCGVNRVSLGVQSFVDHEAQAVGRSHTEATCRAEFTRLRRAGIGNIGADLIAGLPYQTEASWEASLGVAATCGLDHLSVYMLEVDDESRLGREVLGGGARLHAPAVPSEDATATMYEQACIALPKAGFTQYEISNFAQGGRASRHNLMYWLREPYLGFGLDAHSMLTTDDGGILRWANAEELSGYDGVSQICEAERPREREIFEECVFLGLRLCDGLPWSRLERFPGAWIGDLREVAAMLQGEGLLRIAADRVCLTQRGRLLSSEVFGELLTATPV